MRTTTCLILLGLGILVAPLATEAQPLGKIPRVGVLDLGFQQQRSNCILLFQQGLRDLGYVEGQTVLFDYRYAEEHPERLPALAAELVQLAPDVIWLNTTAAALVAKRTITTIPVVGVGTYLEELGIIASLAQPGGNITGLDNQLLEVMENQLELFKAAVPTMAHVAVLVNPARPEAAHIPGDLARKARALGLQLQRIEAGAPEAFEAAFAAMVQGGADALMILDSGLFATHRQRLLALALQHRLPTMSGGPQYAEAGSLLSYGVYVPELCQRSAVLVAKILKGARPADLPVERADKFYRQVNLKTAEALGLTIPRHSLCTRRLPLGPLSTPRRVSCSFRVHSRKRIVTMYEQVLYHAHGCREQGISTTRRGDQGVALYPARAARLARAYLSE